MGGRETTRGADHDDARRLTVELEAALLRELRVSFDELNQSYFKRALRPPEIKISDSRRRLGQWDSSRRRIEMSRSLFVKEPWGTVLEVLKHEMAHQYVHEILGRVDEPSHGPAFREVCEKLGIDSRAAGLPAGPPCETDDGRQQHVKVLERIAQLLALAQSSNVHEAQAATSLAQKLMLKYNVESAALGTRGGYEFRHLGIPSGRVSESERLLSIILGQHFFVEVIWVPVYRPLEKKRGHVLEICGTRPNLEMASYVHAFLLRSAEHLWAEHKREQRHQRQPRSAHVPRGCDGRFSREVAGGDQTPSRAGPGVGRRRRSFQILPPAASAYPAHACRRPFAQCRAWRRP